MRTAIFLTIIISYYSQAQIQSLDLNSAGIGSNGSVRYFNPTLTGSDNAKLNYSDIRGRYLWDEKWKPAKVTTKRGAEFYIKQVKLNFYTNEIHYKNNKGEELVAGGNIKSIQFFNLKDTTREEGYFKFFVTNDGETLLEVLCDGKIQFMKRTVVNLVKGSYDVMAGRYDYRFVTTTKYFVKTVDAMTQLSSLNKESIAQVISFSRELDGWLLSNKNKLKRETDFIIFFNHYNQLK